VGTTVNRVQAFRFQVLIVAFKVLPTTSIPLRSRIQFLIFETLKMKRNGGRRRLHYQSQVTAPFVVKALLQRNFITRNFTPTLTQKKTSGVPHSEPSESIPNSGVLFPKDVFLFSSCLSAWVLKPYFSIALFSFSCFLHVLPTPPFFI